MCGRFTLSTPASRISQLFRDFPLDLAGRDFGKSYNIAPTQSVWAVGSGFPAAESAITAHQLHWGLVPSWARDRNSAAKLINARGESVATKPSFRSAFKKRRCLVPADGFFEWKKVGSGKQPYYIQMDAGEPFCFAGIWESWSGDADAAPLLTCSLITTAANSAMSPLHHRMPVILQPADFPLWLDPETQQPELLEPLLAPQEDLKLLATPVSTLVNKPANNSPACIEPVEAAVVDGPANSEQEPSKNTDRSAADRPGWQQGTLFDSQE